MSAHFANWDDRALELAVDQVTVGLDASDRADLQGRVREDDLEDFERVVAMLHLSTLGQLEEPPAELVRKIEQNAQDHFSDRPAPAPMPAAMQMPGRMSLVTVSGWLAAALLVGAFLLRDVFQSTPPDDRARRDLLVATGPDVVRLEWQETEDPLAEGVAGGVAWSKDRQEGYLSFRGLEPNDPDESQYQLWIFDTTRHDWEAKPVDGGVFDVAGEDVVVAIDPKLEVREAALFAITLEVPGGVVVSERERLVVTAAP